MHTNPWQFISTFVAGVLLAWLLIETGSLVPCLFAHAVANGTGYVAGLAAGGGSPASRTGWGMPCSSSPSG